MLEIVTHRAAHARDMWREGLWGKVLTALWGLYGIFAAIRQEAFTPDQQANLLLLKMIPHLSLAWWAAGAFATLTIWSFEASFRVDNKLKINISERDSLINALNAKLNPKNEIELIFRGTMPSGTAEGYHLGFIVHATNSSGRTLNDCRFETSVPMDGDFADVPNWCSSSPPFSMHPGGWQNCEILSGSLTDPDAFLSIVEFSQTDGKWSAENPVVTRLVPPGLYTVFVRVIAEDMIPATMALRLTHEGRWDAQDISKR